MVTKSCAASSRQKEKNPANRLLAIMRSNPDTVSDRLLTYREVHALVGSTCKSGHYARSLAAQRLIRVVRLNSRTFRYSEQSVLALINGKDAPSRPAIIADAANAAGSKQELLTT